MMRRAKMGLCEREGVNEVFKETRRDSVARCSREIVTWSGRN
jgi:hypothetical protein